MDPGSNRKFAVKSSRDFAPPPSMTASKPVSKPGCGCVLRGHQMLKAREQELVGGAEKNKIHFILSGFAHLFVLTGDLRERELVCL